jgi:hypothetical protein
VLQEDERALSEHGSRLEQNEIHDSKCNRPPVKLVEPKTIDQIQKGD